jgi:DNA-3-methyladenine glycosylase II
MIHAIPVVAPYRLDLTVSVLRRTSGNLVDVLTPEGEYLRVLDAAANLGIVRVRQVRPETLSVAIEDDGRDPEQRLELVRRILGLDVNLGRFYQSAARIGWLNPLVLRMRGVKPPRYPTLWEACVNAIVFQQVSLLAASSIMRRLILSLEEPLERGGVQLYRFPSAERVAGAEDTLLRAAGLSAGKLATLRRVGEMIVSGALHQVMLEERSSPDAAALLCGIKGIGPWTAAVILLRGLGRLDGFPANDTSVARNLALVAGGAPLDVGAVLTILGPERGMLYYHLLLARLEARGTVVP